MSNIHNPVVASIKYNIAWHTKSKSPILTGEIKPRLQVILRQVCTERGIQILGGGIGKSYVYMKLDCPAHHAASDIVQRLKGRSSKMLRDEYPSIRDKSPEGALWDSGYLCQSYGNDDLEFVKNYIRDGGFQPSL